VAPVILAASACLALNHWVAVDLVNFFEAGQRVGPLDQRLSESREVIWAKNAVVNELIAGRLTLCQATERFRELHALVEDGNDEVVGPFQVVRGEEALCRNVLIWVRAELYHRSRQEGDEVFARLRAEYRERFGYDPGPWPSPLP
jgi:hypothetical protein